MDTTKNNSVQTVQPYLFFDGCSEEAIYRGTLGAEVTMLTRFKDSPDPNMCPAAAENKVMPCQPPDRRSSDAYDGRCER
jgi:PhnB protein